MKDTLFNNATKKKKSFAFVIEINMICLTFIDLLTFVIIIIPQYARIRVFYPPWAKV